MSYSIDHINRYVSNVDKFIEFYQSKLDYRLIALGKRQKYIKDPDCIEIDLIQGTNKHGFYQSLKMDKED